jgi:hypothetical protein
LLGPWPMIALYLSDNVFPLRPPIISHTQKFRL